MLKVRLSLNNIHTNLRSFSSKHDKSSLVYTEIIKQEKINESFLQWDN